MIERRSERWMDDGWIIGGGGGDGWLVGGRKNEAVEKLIK